MSRLDTSGELLTHADWQETLVSETRLLGQECAVCERRMATPKAACIRCGSRDVRTISLPSTGTVFSETTARVAPAGFDGGYQLIIVEFDSARILGRVEGEPDLDIGDRVQLVDSFEMDGDAVPVFATADRE